MELKFDIKNQIMKRKDKEEIVQKSRNLVIASFLFSDEWEDLDKFALFADSHDRTHTVHLKKSLNETCVVPAAVLHGRYFTVSVYAGDLITTNAVTVYLRSSTYHNHRCEDIHHRSYEKDIFVEIFEKLNEKIDDIVFDNDSIQFYAEDELIQSISLPFADENKVSEWMTNINEKLKATDETIEEMQGQILLKSDIGHVHSKVDVVDFDDEISSSNNDLLSSLTDALNEE